MMSRLEKIKAGQRHVRTIRFPGTDQDAGLRVLTNAERQQALFATEDHFRKHGIEFSAATVEAFEDENTTQMLALALRDPVQTDRTFAAGADELRGLLTRDEKNELVAAYEEFEQEVSPSASDLTGEELDELLEALKKNAGDWERFKWRNAQAACCYFGRPALELTEGQWLYALAMTTPDKPGGTQTWQVRRNNRKA